MWIDLRSSPLHFENDSIVAKFNKLYNLWFQLPLLLDTLTVSSAAILIVNEPKTVSMAWQHWFLI